VFDAQLCTPPPIAALGEQGQSLPKNESALPKPEPPPPAVPPAANASIDVEHQARDAIAAAQVEIDAARAEGKDTMRAQSMLSAARLALENGNFVQALSQANAAPKLAFLPEKGAGEANASAAPQADVPGSTFIVPGISITATGAGVAAVFACIALYLLFSRKKKSS
jgi:hypothetical protein